MFIAAKFVFLGELSDYTDRGITKDDPAHVIKAFARSTSIE